MIVEAVLLNFLRMTIFYAIPYVAALALQVPLSLSDLINVLLMSACIHMLNALTPRSRRYRMDRKRIYSDICSSVW